MKNLSIKMSISAISLIGLISAANASVVPLPEPSTFGLFAGAATVVIILTRIMKKK